MPRWAMLQLDVIVLTKDEEKNLPCLLDSLSSVGARVFVVDSGSSDRTCEIARARGCEVVLHPFDTHARQLNWAIDNLPLDDGWIMRLDADERLTPELSAELAEKLDAYPAEIAGLLF